MRIIQSLFLIIGIITISSCSSDSVVAPSTESMTKIVMHWTSGFGDMNMVAVAKDSVRWRIEQIDNGRLQVKEKTAYRKNILDSVLRIANLNDVWNISAPSDGDFYSSLSFYTKPPSSLADSQDSLAKQIYYKGRPSGKFEPILAIHNKLYALAVEIREEN